MIDGYKFARKFYDINQIMKKRGIYHYNSNDKCFYGTDDSLYINTKLSSKVFIDDLTESGIPSFEIDGQEFFNADKNIKEFNKNSKKEDPDNFDKVRKQLFFDIDNLVLRDNEDGDILYSFKRVRSRDIEEAAYKWDKKPRKINITHINGIDITSGDALITDILNNVVKDEDLYSWTISIDEENNELVVNNYFDALSLDLPYIHTNKNLFIKLDCTKKNLPTQFMNVFINENEKLDQIGIEYGTSDYKITHCANIILHLGNND